MTDTTTTKPEVKLSYYHRRSSIDPEYKQKENNRITTYITKKYHEDPEFRAKRLEYQKAYDTEKRAKMKELKESLKYVTFPCESK